MHTHIGLVAGLLRLLFPAFHTFTPIYVYHCKCTLNVDGATTLGKLFGCALYTCACHAIRRLAAEAQAIQQHLDVDEAELVSVHKIVEGAAKENASLRADNDSLRKQLVREQLLLAHNSIGIML